MLSIAIDETNILVSVFNAAMLWYCHDSLLFQVSSLNIYHLRSLENGADLFRRENPAKESTEENVVKSEDQGNTNFILFRLNTKQKNVLKEMCFTGLFWWSEEMANMNLKHNY
jgi:hypothetical protein